MGGDRLGCRVRRVPAKEERLLRVPRLAVFGAVVLLDGPRRHDCAEDGESWHPALYLIIL